MWISPYLSNLKIQARIVLQYRAQAWAGVFTQGVFGFIRVSLMIALFKAQPLQAMSLEQTVTYVWFTQMLLTFIAWGPDPLISAMVKDGTLAYEMVRPVRLSLMWYMRSLSFRGVIPLMRGLPIMLIASLLPKPLRLTWPSIEGMSVMETATWATTMVLCLAVAWLLAGAINNFINIAVVALMSDDGLVRLMPVVVFLFGGLIMPMPLFPDVMQGFIKAMPFVGIMDMPARVFSGHLAGIDALMAILFQCVWLLAIVAINDLWLESRLKRAVIQGG